jgi:D-3-phosphoglycerate dehydrogenase
MSATNLRQIGITPADLDAIWSKSDFITVHTPLTPETSNLINDETIGKCKTGVSLF